MEPKRDRILVNKFRASYGVKVLFNVIMGAQSVQAVENQWFLMLKIVSGIGGIVFVFKIISLFGGYQERKFLREKTWPGRL